MNCPIDNTTLVMSDRNGIEIDYCPQCRGVWLDRGELDKIIERSETGGRVDRQSERPSYHEEPSHDKRGYDQNHRKPKKRESFLSDLFDFGD